MSDNLSAELVSSSACFGGRQEVYSHQSRECQCRMKFSIYLPPKVVTTDGSNTGGQKVPVIYYLPGLHNSEQEFIIKTGFQRYAAEQGVIVVGTDTSPRGVDIDGQHTDPDFGSSAGFYVDATEPKWRQHYRMHSYITKELPEVIEHNFPVIVGLKSIFGHSMGGHGALVCALKNPGLYKSVSALAPLANPTKDGWSKKWLSGYLGDNTGNVWEEWDASVLVTKYRGPALNLLVDWGTVDPYMPALRCQNFVDACLSANIPIDYHLHDGYDHSSFHVSTYIGEHIRHHSTILYELLAEEK
ncbi:S-formylglutathione hydrolase-like [Oppia nitens]|uniref:S-formylglutathione hydrolase-like n=1 Tax=Oppia nitens TaxID=1686743 RepID=UPI0023DA5CA8|nr:S-formylglutathione hydrolase-like [Oppia nitens]